MKISFHGAARQVTGSKHLLTLKNGKNILLDCGLFQGRRRISEPLNKHWGFDPSSIDAVILSHAHIDHSGLIPKLVKEGFKGKIYCTPATFDLCSIMLPDSGFIQEMDAQYENKRRIKEGKKIIEPLYTSDEAYESLKILTFPPAFLMTWFLLSLRMDIYWEVVVCIWKSRKTSS
jgi:metallo-beta-lactamase family protein